MLQGLNEDEASDGVIVVRFELTLDGTLDVTATEHHTGRSKSLKIDNALSQMGDDGESVVGRLDERYGGAETMRAEFGEAMLGEPAFAASQPASDTPPETGEPQSKLKRLVEQARQLQPSLETEDSEDIDRLLSLIEQAEQDGAEAMLDGLQSELEDILFYAAE